jgi:hypothetical protein
VIKRIAFFIGIEKRLQVLEERSQVLEAGASLYPEDCRCLFVKVLPDYDGKYLYILWLVVATKIIYPLWS